MGIKRPSVKIPFWNPGFKNKPDVEPPGFLRLISAFAMASIVGVLLYSALIPISGMGGAGISAEAAIYVAFLHFVLPIAIAYTIVTNSPLSRILIILYSTILCIATLAGKGFLGTLSNDAIARGIVATILLVIVIAWLVWSPKSRYYYARIANRPVPPELEARSSELDGRNWISPRAKTYIEWAAGHLETVVLVGFVIVVVYAYLSMG